MFLLLAVVVAGSIYIVTQSYEGNSSDFLTSLGVGEGVFPDDTSPEDGSSLYERYRPNVPETRSEGSSGGSSGSDNLEGEESCSQEKISYTLSEFDHSEECLQYDGEICTEKEMRCSLMVTNRDDDVGGQFTIKFMFLNEADSIISDESVQHDLGPGETISFVSVVNLIGEEAGASYECDFEPEQVPTQEVCVLLGPSFSS